MRHASPRRTLLLFAALTGTALFGAGSYTAAGSQFASPVATEAALRAALFERRRAEQRSERLEAEAARATVAADRAAREAAALAARVQQAEAGIGAAETRLALADRQRKTLREAFGREQGPLVRLTAALQQFSRRPVALSILRPGSVSDVVYTRAILASTVPVVEQRTAGLRTNLARSRALQIEARRAIEDLGSEKAALAERRQQLAAIESRQRLASRAAGGGAEREAERALLLAEEARDLDALVGELGRAANLRQRLAALTGPVLRPARPELARATPAPSPPGESFRATPPPAPYILPVTGRAVAGFAAPSPSGPATGLTLAPRPGAQVVAPAPGRVAFAGPYRGYGRIIIIEHGGTWTSLLTGLARVDVRVGELVVGGAPLGVAGQTRPTVTLELRRGDEPVNPLEFVG
ncbi:MAG: murein hydrolase activator EnvC family protein [Croceibacterium sp.]